RMVDYNIISYPSYRAYQLSFTTVQDFRYLPNHKTVTTFSKLGFRDTRSYLEEDEFLAAQKRVQQILNPTVSSILYYRKYFKGRDPALVALADREYGNVQQAISTIIFLEISGKSGFNESGYIDFEASLRNCRLKGQYAVNWRAVFEEEKLLRPQQGDLVFYDWRTRKVFATDNDNYRVICDPQMGLMFNHKGDHKMVPVTSRKNFFSHNVRRQMIKSPLYGFMILYDHQIRKKT
ncbi:hypothetical protein KR018_012500, partial [Drosophila ironensis]